MPTTPFLGIQQVSANQSQKEVTINDAILALESASCGTLVVPFTSGLTQTLSVDQFTHSFLFTPTGATADAVLQVPHAINGNPTQRLFGVRNASGHGVTVRSDTTGGDTVVIPNGEARLLAIADNDIFIAAEPGVAVAFLGLSDVPHAYTAKGGQALVATMAEDGLEFVALVKSIDNLSDVDTTTSAPGTGQFLKWSGAQWVPSDLPLSSSTLLGLTDVPDSYSGAANQFLRVNGAANGIEFIAINQVPGGGTSGQILTKGSGSAYSWAAAPVALPAGGTTGQVLAKASDTDGDAEWVDGGSGGGGGVPDGGTVGQILIKQSSTNGDAEWEDLPLGEGLYRFGTFFTETPISDEILLMHDVTDPFTLPANMANSKVKVTGVNPAATFVMTMTRDRAGVITTAGTITISTTGVVTLATTGAASIDFVAGDVITLTGQHTADTAITNVTFSFRGNTYTGAGGGSSSGGGVAPTIVQISTPGRTDAGTTAFATTCTAGNTIMLVYSGFALPATPTGYGLVYSWSQSNQTFALWAKISDGTEDTVTFVTGGGSDGQCVAYEFEGVVSITTPVFGYQTAANYKPILLSPTIKNAIYFLSAEGDTAATWSTATSGVTVDYTTPGSTTGNHYGIFAHTTPGFTGQVTLTSTDTANKAVGYFAVGIVSGGGGGDSSGSGPWYLQPPVAADYPTALTGGASTLALTDDADVGLIIDGGIHLAGDIVRGAVRTITTPTGDWSFAAKIEPLYINDNYSSAGILIRDSVGGKLLMWRLGNGVPQQISKVKQTALTTYSSDNVFGDYGPQPFMRVRKVGTNLFFDVSTNGKVWINVASEAVATFIGTEPDQIGFGIITNKADANNNAYLVVPYAVLSGSI